MHGCGSGTALLVNAEVDSMGGVVDGGVGIGVKTSPHRAAIEKAQAALRQEYDVREERRRELDFLEKGGNPLDFKFGNAASVSVHSTSLTDQQAEQFVTSEAKGSFALTASPHGDSVESSGRPGIRTVCEPNSADNLLLFDGENELRERERTSKHPIKRKSFVPSEQSSRMDGTQNAKESEDSAIFRPYARRNRSKIKRDAARSSSNDIVQARVGDGSSLTVRGSSRDAKRSISDSNYQKEQSTNPKAATSNGDIVSKVVTSDNHINMELDRIQAPAITTSPKVGFPDDKWDSADTRFTDGQHNQPAKIDAQRTSEQVDAPQTSGQIDEKTHVDMATRRSDIVGGNEQIVSAGVDRLPCESTEKATNESCFNQQKGFGDQDRDRNSIPIKGLNSSLAVATKLDSESSCTHNSLNVDVHTDSDVCITLKNVDSNGVPTEKTSDLDGIVHLADGEMVKEENEIKIYCGAAMNEDQSSAHQNQSNNSAMINVEEEKRTRKSDLQNDKNSSNVLRYNANSYKENLCSGRSQGVIDISTSEPPEKTVLGRNTADAPDCQNELGNNLTLADKEHEDSILKEATIIEAKRKRIAELSVRTLPFETRRKSHWDFVLEEMTWLANDFAQERLWKMTAAAQICHRVAFTSRLRAEEQNQCYKLKQVALNLAKAVMQFWHSAGVLLNGDDPTVGPKASERDLVGSPTSEDKETGITLEQHCPRKNIALPIHGYAARFLKHNNSPVPPLQAEAVTPGTPDKISDSGINEVSWDDHLTEESLFYAVYAGAMENYRKSIESHVTQSEKTATSMQEEVDTSMYEAVAEFGYQGTAFDEDDGEMSAYYLPGPFEGRKLSKFAHKKRKHFIKYMGRSYEVGAEFSYGHGTVGSQLSMMGKRPGSNLNVGSIPTKRMRTASRQRIIGPFSAGASGSLQAPAKTDASSGDTNSFQDDQSTLHGGSQNQKSLEVESAGDYEKQLTYDCAEASTKPKKKKKKKKAKHLGSSIEQGWQLESTIYNEQRDHSKKRLESHPFDSNGNNGLYGQHNPKKPKKQSLDTTFDNIAPMTGSIPSPAASQMSNMSNPTKFIKLISGRDRGRKAKALKMSAGQPGSGIPWSIFEDQALVVLVHDMGPNWELVSDAMNSTLQFKCIFRKPQECKERHKVLMDKGAGDGADSAEDSGSSQSYPSTLPGIPKGSARQLFQRLQGPVEEDAVKSHFEKIIMIGKKYHYRKSQNDNHDPRQVVQVHNSHVIAVSQVCPNNLNGGSILTPLDFCDVTASSPDALSLSFQGSHPSGLGILNQGAMLHTSGANSPLQGSTGIVLGSNLSSPSGPLNHPFRDGRYNVPRANLPVDDQQRMQQYNQSLSGRNMQQSNLPASGTLSGAERGARLLPGGNGMGMMCGMNRNIPMSRPGFQGMASSPMLNSGSMLSSTIGGMSPVNLHSGAGPADPGQGNSMLRPRDTMHMMRPGHNPDHQKQLMVPELQMQVTQGNSQGIPAFNGLSSAFSNQTATPPVQTYSGHAQQPHQLSLQQAHGLSNHHPHLQGPNHATGSQQQAYAIRLAKERQIQQRYLQQQQQQFAASSALMPHAPSLPQLPISSSLQNNAQIQPQTSSQPVSMPPVTTSSSMTPIAQHQQKHHLPSHGLCRNSQSGVSGLINQVGKQRQRQPLQQQFQQPGRNHPQQRQHAQSQQQAKLAKGIGRGNMVLHQNLNVDHLNGNQAADKGEQIMHLMQGQGLYSGSSISPVEPSKPSVPSQSTNHSHPQQKLFSGPSPPSSKQFQQAPSPTDSSSHGQVPPISAGRSPSATQPVVASYHQHLQLQPLKQINQIQSQPTAQRILQQSRQLKSDMSNKSQTDLHQADQPVSNAAVTGASATTTSSQVSADSGNVGPVSSAVGKQWNSSEPVYDSGLPNIANQVGLIGSPPLTNSGRNDAVTSVSPESGQRQLSGSLLPHGSNIGSQWQQQSQLQQSPTQHCSQQNCQPHDPQVLQQDQQQLPLQQQSHQQTQHLQAPEGISYIRPTDTKLE